MRDGHRWRLAAVRRDFVGQRLVREATFTLVTAGRPEIKNALLDVFAR
ncbi:MAG: hypothetical protein ACRD0H_27600 [Actinomycetes bacterium]